LVSAAPGCEMLLHSVEPQIPGVQVHGLPVTKDGKTGIALIVRTPNSWEGPHRVGPTRRFHIRENGHKRELGVPEIKGLFLRSEGQSQRIRDFRTERLGKILIGDLPCKLKSGPALFVHVVPLRSALGLVPATSSTGLPPLALRKNPAPLKSASTACNPGQRDTRPSPFATSVLAFQCGVY
jgi:hypothetical protein